MNKPNITLLGVYKLSVTEDLITKSIIDKYGANFISNEKYKKIVIEELNSTYLLELLIEHPDNKYSIDDFSQDSNDQAVYEESYYSLDYKTNYNYTKPNIDSFKLLFWFHFLDFSKPLNTSYCKIIITNPQPMTEFLSNLKYYLPVD